MSALCETLSLPLDDEIISHDRVVAISNQLWGEPYYGHSFLNLLYPQLSYALGEMTSQDEDVLTLSEAYGYTWPGLYKPDGTTPAREAIENEAQRLWAQHSLPYLMKSTWVPIGPYVQFKAEVGPLSRLAITSMYEQRDYNREPLPGTVDKGLKTLTVAAELEKAKDVDRSAYEADGSFVSYGTLQDIIRSSPYSERAQQAVFYKMWKSLQLQADGCGDRRDPDIVVEGPIGLRVNGIAGDSCADTLDISLSADRVSLESAHWLVDGLKAGNL